MENLTRNESFGYITSSVYFQALPNTTKTTAGISISNVVNVFVGLFGIVDNAIVILVFVWYVGVGQQITNIFIVNQSCIDMLASFWVLVFGIDYGTERVMDPNSSMDQFLCRIWVGSVPLWATLVSSTGNIMGVTLERYTAIVYPVLYKTTVNKCKVYVAIATAWLYGFVLHLPWKILTSQIDVDGKCHARSVWPSRAVQQAVAVLGVITEYFGPVALMFFCYCRIIIVLRLKINPNVPAAEQYHHKASVNVLKTLIAVSVCFFGCWTFNEILWINFLAGGSTDFDSWYSKLSIALVLISCCINPVIYAAQHHQFQNGARRLLGRLKAEVLFFSATGTTESD